MPDNVPEFRVVAKIVNDRRMPALAKIISHPFFISNNVL